MKAKVWIKNKDIIGWPKLEDFTLKEEKLSECNDGGIVKLNVHMKTYERSI